MCRSKKKMQRAKCLPGQAKYGKGVAKKTSAEPVAETKRQPKSARLRMNSTGGEKTESRRQQ
jgi:hypothetical protein